MKLILTQNYKEMKKKKEKKKDFVGGSMIIGSVVWLISGRWI